MLYDLRKNNCVTIKNMENREKGEEMKVDRIKQDNRPSPRTSSRGCCTGHPGWQSDHFSDKISASEIVLVLFLDRLNRISASL